MDKKLEHEKMVKALTKPGSQLVAEITPLKAILNHLAPALAGEVGELLDAFKQLTVYNKTLDMANVVEELGDIEFYLEAIRQELHLSRSEILRGNISKLSKRYADGEFTDQAAQQRADKQ